MTPVVATVNMERVLSETKEGKRIIDDIRNREEPKKQEYQRLVNDVMGLRNKLQTMGPTLKPEEALQMRQSIEQKELTALRFQETTLRDLENYRLETMADFEKKVFPVIDRLAKEKKLTFLFPYPQRWVIYADPAVDMTDEIIAAIDQAVVPGAGGGKAGGGAKPMAPGGGPSVIGSRPKGNVKV